MLISGCDICAAYVLPHFDEPVCLSDSLPLAHEVPRDANYQMLCYRQFIEWISRGTCLTGHRIGCSPGHELKM